MSFKISHNPTADIEIVRKSIKHLYLRVDRDSRVVVSAPKRMPLKTIQAFIDGKQAWICQKQRQQARRQARAAAYLHAGNDHPNELRLFATSYPLSYRQGAKNNQLRLTEEGACVYLRKNATAQTLDNVLKRFYRQQLLLLLKQQVSLYQPVIGVSVNEIRIRQMKSKWGTCNTSAKRLWFNLQLARLPRQCSEYVVVHEMTHLLERYHNRRFYALLEKAMPNWRIWHNYLKSI